MTDAGPDPQETRSPDERAADLARELPELVAHAKGNAPAYAGVLRDIDPAAVTDMDALAALPVTRKSDLAGAQTRDDPLGGYTAAPAVRQQLLFQSPGPIYEPGVRTGDWWRLGRFLRACGICAEDIVLNSCSYHLTPAGVMFESAAVEAGATVIPAGTGQSELQARAAAHLGATAYAGTPDFLKVVLDKGDELGLDLTRLRRAAVGGGALFPSLRQEYADRGIRCLQFYGTADVGSIAFESPAMEGMIVDEGVVVEIVTPGTGAPVAPGEVGEVLVTCLNPDYPLIRFATGDLSSAMPGQSPCGRTNMRITGWRGRADQTTKVRGMFIRPEQVALFVARHEAVVRARVVVGRTGQQDSLDVHVEVREDGARAEELAASAREILKLRGRIRILEPGTLANDGLVIEDRRSYDE